MSALNGVRVALIATDGFENAELFEPRRALLDAGAVVEVISIKAGQVQGYREFEQADPIAVDRRAADANATEYDALLLPGGTINADKLRADNDVLRLVRGFFDEGKPVAALCHAPWVLIDAGVAEGRRLTSYRSIRRDLDNAGADWTDGPAVIDRNLLTSREPKDIPTFNAAMLQLFRSS